MHMTVTKEARARYPRRNFETLAPKLVKTCEEEITGRWGWTVEGWDAEVRFLADYALVNFQRPCTGNGVQFVIHAYDLKGRIQSSVEYNFY